MNKYIFSIILILFGLNIANAETEEFRDIFFPSVKTVTFQDDYGNARYQHSHEANDLMGPKMTPVYAAVDGVVSYITIPEASYGFMVVIKDSDDWTYNYIHMNNDTPGTDDGNGGTEYAFATGIRQGARVIRGQLLGWMGDSGNAENIASHLHFEIRRPDETSINPYKSLMKAMESEETVNSLIENYINISKTINSDKNIVEKTNSNCESDTVYKITTSNTLYYCGSNGKRYVFPNEKIYFSWYGDFSEVKTITDEEIAKMPLAGNVTYKPGVKMIKIKTDPKVYIVDKGGVLRWIQSEEVAISLYGADWNKNIDDLPDSFFFDYRVGEDISSI